MAAMILLTGASGYRPAARRWAPAAVVLDAAAALQTTAAAVPTAFSTSSTNAAPTTKRSRRVGSPDREYLWILARTPRLDEERAAVARAVARANKFAVEGLIQAAHERNQR